MSNVAIGNIGTQAQASAEQGWHGSKGQARDLPFDVIDGIVRHCSPRALSNLARVCRAFLPLARRGLYKHLTVDATHPSIIESFFGPDTTTLTSSMAGLIRTETRSLSLVTSDAECSKDNEWLVQMRLISFLHACSPHLDELEVVLGDLPTPVYSSKEKVLLVGGEWSFPELRSFACDSINGVLYKVIMSSSPKLEKVELRKMANVLENVLLAVPSCVHQLQVFCLSATHEPPETLLPTLVHLKNLKKLPSLRYTGYGDGHPPGAVEAEAELLDYFEALGIQSTPEKRHILLGQR